MLGLRETRYCPVPRRVLAGPAQGRRFKPPAQAWPRPGPCVSDLGYRRYVLTQDGNGWLLRLGARCWRLTTAQVVARLRPAEGREG